MRQRHYELLEMRYAMHAVSFVPHEISMSTDFNSVTLGDMNNDGHLDIVLAGWKGVSWRASINGDGTFDRTRPIASGGWAHPITSDFDGDGDTDLFASKRDGWQRFVFVNEGRGDFATPRMVGGFISAYGSSAPGDVDSDGDEDLVGTNGWFESVPGNFILHEFGKEPVPDSVRFHDVDSDNDLDIVAAFQESAAPAAPGPNLDVSDWLEWVENTDGHGSFGDWRLLTDKREFSWNPSYTRFVFGDIDGDSDDDVLLSQGHVFAPIALTDWYENVDGTFVGPNSIGITGDSPSLVDVDGDGKRDIVAGSDVRKTKFPELVDAEGASSVPEYELAAHDFGDIDGDGDLDALGQSGNINDGWRLTWYENRLAGDTNGNGEVTLEDFLALSANFGKAVDAVWEDGDFDANGTVDFADFLMLAENFGNKRPMRNL